MTKYYCRGHWLIEGGNTKGRHGYEDRELFTTSTFHVEVQKGPFWDGNGDAGAEIEASNPVEAASKMVAAMYSLDSQT